MSDKMSVGEYVTRASLKLSRLREVNRARRNAWTGTEDWTGADWSNEMCGEVGEAANVVKKLRRIETGAVRAGKDAPLKSDLLDQLANELADVIITADLLGMFYGVDLGNAVVRKFNRVSDKVGLEDYKL